MKIFLKYSGATILGLVVILVLAVGITQTSFFRDWLRLKIIAAANTSDRSRVSIGSIEGNIFSHLEVRTICWTKGNDTLVLIPSFRAEYEALGLLKGALRLNSVYFDSAIVNASGIINHLNDQHEQPPASTVTESGRLIDSIMIEGLNIDNATILIANAGPEDPMPTRLQGVHLRLQAILSARNQFMDLQEFSFYSDAPRLILRNMSCTIHGDQTQVSVNNLRLSTALNAISGNGTMQRKSGGLRTLHLSSSSFDIKELSSLLPGIPPSTRPLLNFEAVQQRDTLSAALVITEGTQRVEFTGKVDPWSVPPTGTVTATFTGIDASKWSREIAFTTLLNGNIEITGSGSTPANAHLEAHGTIFDSHMMRRSVKKLTFASSLAGPKLSAQFEANGTFGAISGAGTVTDRFSKPLLAKPVFASSRFTIDAQTRHLNLAAIMNDTSYRSDISARMKGGGNVATFDSMGGAFTLSSRRSAIMHIPLDTLFSEIRTRPEGIFIDTLAALFPVSTLTGTGMISRHGNSLVNLQGSIHDLARLRHLVGADTLAGAGTWDATLSGSADSLDGFASATLHGFLMDSLKIGLIGVHCSIAGSHRDPLVDFVTRFTSCSYGSIAWDSAGIDGISKNRKVDASLTMRSGDSVEALAHVSMNLDSSKLLALPSLSIRLKKSTWNTATDSGRFILKENKFAVEDFRLVSGGQSITASGTMGTDRNSHLLAEVRDLELLPFQWAINTPKPIGGSVNASLDISGSSLDPEITTICDVKDLSYDTSRLGSIRAEAHYRDSNLTWNIGVHSVPGGDFNTDGSIPFHRGREFSRSPVDTSKPMHFSLTNIRADLSHLHMFSKLLDSAAGILAADVHLLKERGTYSGDGKVTLTNGRLKIARAGIEYPSLSAALSVEDSVIRLDSLRIKGTKGELRAGGTLWSAEQLFHGDLTPGNVRIALQRFQALKSHDADLLVDGNILLASSHDSMLVDGDLTVIQSRWYLPAFLKQFKPATPLATPLLVKATTGQDTARSTVVDTGSSHGITLHTRPINGNVRITISRGTWLESTNLLVEASGDMRIAFVNSQPEFFGNVEIHRGWVQAFGVRLTFDESKISFNGGMELNPGLDLKMEYAYRDENREKKTILMTVQGQAKDPEINFTLDGKAIEDEDAYSYMLFGRSASGMSSGQKSDMSNTANQMVEQMTSSIVSSKLSATVGKSLGLDVIELRGTDNWSKASLTAGEYVSDKVYVSVEKGFGKYEADEVVPQVLTVEYELFRFLFFQIVSGTDNRSGVDVLLKFN